MRTAPVTRHATYADVLAAPANMVAELIEGSLVTRPRPSPRHGVAASSLGEELKVLSPSTENWDRGPKRRIYADTGVPFLPLVDPRAKLIEAFALTGSRWLLVGTVAGQDDVCLAPFDAVSFPLKVLWPLDPPDADDENA
jgi:hypothetical protein